MSRSPIGSIRLRHFETAELAAKKLGCSTAHLRHVERGRAMPSPELMARMAKAFQVPLDEIHYAIKIGRRELLERSLNQIP